MAEHNAAVAGAASNPVTLITDESALILAVSYGGRLLERRRTGLRHWVLHK